MWPDQWKAPEKPTGLSQGSYSGESGISNYPKKGFFFFLWIQILLRWKVWESLSRKVADAQKDSGLWHFNGSDAKWRVKCASSFLVRSSFRSDRPRMCQWLLYNLVQFSLRPTWPSDFLIINHRTSCQTLIVRFCFLLKKYFFMSKKTLCQSLVCECVVFSDCCYQWQADHQAPSEVFILWSGQEESWS